MILVAVSKVAKDAVHQTKRDATCDVTDHLGSPKRNTVGTIPQIGVGGHRAAKPSQNTPPIQNRDSHGPCPGTKLQRAALSAS